jgi:hypothetical protein
MISSQEKAEGDCVHNVTHKGLAEHLRVHRECASEASETNERASSRSKESRYGSPSEHPWKRAARECPLSTDPAACPDGKSVGTWAAAFALAVFVCMKGRTVGRAGRAEARRQCVQRARVRVGRCPDRANSTQPEANTQRRYSLIGMNGKTQWLQP